jgi:hypothetical protein
VDHKPSSCPECEGNMHFRLGEYECEACGKRTPALAGEHDERLPTRRVSVSPTVRTAAPSREFDVERGTRR